MHRASTARRSRPEKRRWSAPPPLTRDAGTPGPEGLSIVGELPSPKGALLWKAFRSILLWASVDPEERDGLFDPGASKRRRAEARRVLRRADPDLRTLIESTLEMLSDPADIAPEAVARTARGIARWARGNGAGRTELEFLRAAAIADPSDAHTALLTGRVAARNLQLSAAEAWMMRAIGLARHSGDMRTYTKAHLAHGDMLVRRGSMPAARRSLTKAARRAIRQGKRDLKAEAFHQLFAFEEISGNPAKAWEHAEDAAELLDPGDRGLHRLVREVALLLLSERHYAEAILVLNTLADVATRIELPLILGPLARAAAASEDDGAFDRAWLLMYRLDASPGTPEAWLEVGRAALVLGRPDQASEAAAAAQRVGVFRPGNQVDFLARILTGAILNGGIAAPDPAQKAPDRVRVLVDRLIELVQKHG